MTSRHRYLVEGERKGPGAETLASKTGVVGLTAGTKYYFRVQA